MKKSLAATIVVVLLLLPQYKSYGQSQNPYDVIPLPEKITLRENEKPFILDKNVKIECEGDELMLNARFLQEYLLQTTGIKIDITSNNHSYQNECGRKIILRKGLQNTNKEAYRINVSHKEIIIDGSSEAGIFYGIQTLRKSLTPGSFEKTELPAAEITDEPRFEWRGMMLDCVRHFFPVDSVKKFIDILALHNCNRFHWHLTDDQGWRIEIKKYPELTKIGSNRKETVIGRNSGKYDGTPYGGYYTQEDAAEVIAYAAKRNITVIPEIDMPGHMAAALASYPELGCKEENYEVWTLWGISENVLCVGKESTFDFIFNVLDEITELFPSQIIHIGGDECPTTAWETCPLCQEIIKSENLVSGNKITAERKLQGYFTKRIEKYLAQKGKRIIGWDEILDGELTKDALIMSWRGTEGGIKAAKKGHNVVMSPNSYLYFDYYQTKDIDKEPFAIGGYIPVNLVYSYEPLPQELDNDSRKQILGLQANLWTEYIPDFGHAQYMTLPRLTALCEVQWCRPEKKDYESFLRRLPRMLNLYDIQGYNYAKHLMMVEPEFSADTSNQIINIRFSAFDNAPVFYTLDGSNPAIYGKKYTETVKIKESANLKVTAIRNGIACKETERKIFFNAATAHPITLLTKPDSSYTYKGATTLVDGLLGNKNYRTGNWIGFYNCDMIAIIDLRQEKEISEAAVNVCVNKDDGCFDARGFKIEVSQDGVNYMLATEENYLPMTEKDDHGIYSHRISFNPTIARYVKITLNCERSIPSWSGWYAGSPAFLFVDEIIIN